MIVKSEQTDIHEEISKLAHEVAARRELETPILKVARLVHEEGVSVPDSLTADDFSAELDRIADKLQARRPTLTDAQAHAAALETPAGRHLYSAILSVKKAATDRSRCARPAPAAVVTNDEEYRRYLDTTGQSRHIF